MLFTIIWLVLNLRKGGNPFLKEFPSYEALPYSCINLSKSIEG